MPLPSKPAKPAGKAAVAAHQHQIPGAPAAKPGGLGGLKAALLGLAATSPKEPKKKGKKDHVIDIPEFSEQLQELQEVNANIKGLTARKEELQGEMYPAIERERRALCQNNMEYIGSVKVKAGPNSGVGTYFIKNQWKGMDPSDEAQRAEAVEVIKTALGLDDEAALEWLGSNMKMDTTVKFNEEALDNPEVVAIIQEHLRPYVTVTTKMVPSKALSEAASYDEQSAAVIDGLEAARLVTRYAGVLKPAGKTGGSDD